MRGALGRLRWQLTLSHLVATAFTLVCLIVAAALFATFMAGLRDSPRREPAQDAQTVARAIEGLAAYPVVDERGRRVGAVVVATSALAPAGGVLGFWRPLLFVGAATVAILAAASLFAFFAASVLAYFLSRRLVSRLERLGQAAEALAAGDLSCRVPEGPADEVGQLTRRFNSMAADLERSLHELEAERDRVAGLLDAQRQLVASVSHELRTP